MLGESRSAETAEATATGSGAIATQNESLSERKGTPDSDNCLRESPDLSFDSDVPETVRWLNCTLRMLTDGDLSERVLSIRRNR